MRLSSLLLVAAAVGGCATAQRPDPLEPMNRKVFAFNESVDAHVLAPVATVYQKLVPEPVRHSVGNFFSNAMDPWSALNLLMQGRVKEGLSDLGRFGTNTVVGVLGLFDPATAWGMPRHGEDFGQTLGAWGVGSGAYIVWPLFGPSTLRDAAGLPLDLLAAPHGYLGNVSLRNSLRLLDLVNVRARFLKAGQLLDDISLDKYSFLRDAYLQRRRSLVHDADPEFDATPDASEQGPASPTETKPGTP